MSPGRKSTVTALAGGIGASKLLLGLYEAMDPHDLTVIVNTGDDLVMHGLRISPDLDIVTYTLAGVVDPTQGWGMRGETFNFLKRLAVYGRETWFNLGDRDLATHVHRTHLLVHGKTLTQAADHIRHSLGVKARILPMSDQTIPTIIETRDGRMHFQEYLIKHHTEPGVRAIHFEGVKHAHAAPGVLEAICDAGRVIICPSNPLISIGPILAVPRVRDQLRARKESVYAVCPIVGGKSLKGPSDKMLMQLGCGSSATAVGKLYADFVGTFVIDRRDASQAEAIRALGMKVAVLPTVMRTRSDKRKLAKSLLAL
ncbi:MAG TPA: 2-phospho-L-lactate transferase [Candidatus Methylomirabilis sp.]|nr:2-phospho-L-lactate transferase [Candidatus Methylomirabilis sp.]